MTAASPAASVSVADGQIFVDEAEIRSGERILRGGKFEFGAEERGSAADDNGVEAMSSQLKIIRECWEMRAKDGRGAWVVGWIGNET